MSYNDAGAVKVPLSTFGGLVTELVPADLPEGVSPDCAEMVFIPGAVSSRPGLRKVFGTPFPPATPFPLVPTVTYAKTYIDPKGRIIQIYLDSDGQLWIENFTSSPGTYSLLAQTSPGCYAKSVTAFGREYIAISNGLLGQEVPLQYDGTNLDRVTQDGPGAPPAVASFAYPSVAMVASGPTSSLTITECDPEGVLPDGSFSAIGVFVASGASAVGIGDQITISGNAAPFNGTWTVTNVYGDTLLWISGISLPAGTVFHLGGSGAIASGTTMRRGQNTVTVQTAAAHHLQVGYQAQITGVPATSVGSVTSAVINNDDLPGICTITTNIAHGLVPGLKVSISGMGAATVANITSASRQGKVVTIVTAAAHKLAPGAYVTISGSTTTSFNSSAFVVAIVDAVTFTFYQDDADATTGATGVVSLNWPVPDTASPQTFEVIAAPTSTTFQIQLSYCNGSWASATVAYAWDGTYYVTAVIDSVTFQYQQYGPNGSTSTVGKVVPYGQIAPGEHSCQVLYLTRQGAITAPSPPVKFIANGGQYLSVSNIPLGPPNVVARILAFTGAGGSLFFYIPVPAMINGQQISTATQIDDNTTTGVILDFSDNTLFAALGINTPGNNLPAQIVLDGALGFGFYGSRLLTWGQRNKILNLLNMSFDGGELPGVLGLPTGWAYADLQGTLSPGHFGVGWQITTINGAGPEGKLSQSMYLDAYGAPIATPNTRYKMRVWLKPSAITGDLSFTVEISSASTSFSATATVLDSQMSIYGSWVEATFLASTPAVIPSDLVISLYAGALTGNPVLLVDELSIIYADKPTLDEVVFGSYTNNPEGFDGVTGRFGAVDDTKKVMDLAIIRRILYFLTQDPSGRLHQTSDNATTEPAGWSVDEIAANCGLLSAFSLTKSQADDSSAGGGEEWFAWASSSGARIFGGDQPWKISQEIQPNWAAINPAAQIRCWALNDPVARVLYFGIPTGLDTAPDTVLQLCYRELDTPYQIAMSPPVKVGLGGKLIASDNARKWSPWYLAFNGAALMYHQEGALTPVFFAGNGSAPGVTATGAKANVYILDAAKFSDDDYGQIKPYYTSHFFVNHEQAPALGLAGCRLALQYLWASLSGIGTGQIQALKNSLISPWPLICARNLQSAPSTDIEWTGAGIIANRIAFRYSSIPLNPGISIDNAFRLEKMTAAMKPAARLPVAGANPQTYVVTNGGGPIVATPRVALIFWGSYWGGSPSPSVGTIISACNTIVGGGYFGKLAQYGVTGTAIIGVTSVTTSSPTSGFNLTDVQTMLNALIAGGAFPAPGVAGGDIIYAVIVPPGVTLSGGGAGVHSLLFYPGAGAGAYNATVTTWASILAQITATWSNELAECVTDPGPVPAWLVNGLEICDVCGDHAGVDPTGQTVAYYFSRSDNACVLP